MLHVPVRTGRNSDSHKLIGTLLGALTKLQEKATISFLMSVCPVRMEQRCTHLTDFREIWYLSNFRKNYGGKIKFNLYVPRILYIGQTYRSSPEYALYIYICLFIYLAGCSTFLNLPAPI